MENNIFFYFIRRLINAIITLIVLVLLVFVLVHVILPTPQAMAKVYIGGTHFSQADVNAIIERYGLNKPIYIQFINYLVNVFKGNLGLDTLYHVPVTVLLAKFIPITLEFVLIAIILQVFLGIITGSIAAMWQNRVPDWVVKALYLITWAMPVFLLATLFQFTFAYYLKVLPPFNIANPLLIAPKTITGFPLIDAAIEGDWTYFDSVLRHMVLPILAIAFAGFGVTTRIMRASAIDVLDKDYVRLAYMKGLSGWQVYFKHALKNALIPIITLVALTFAFAIAGAVVVEEIFIYKGMGFYLYESTVTLDYQAILSTTLIIGIAVIIANFIADILYAVVDPRVRLE